MSSVPGIAERFEAIVAKHPDRVALSLSGLTLDYAALNRRANRLAHHLRGLGLTPDEPVGLCLPRGFDAVVTMLAILKAGGAYLPLPEDYPDARIHTMLTDADATRVVTLSALAPRFADFSVVALDTLQLPSDSSNPPIIGDAERLAYVIYTSGSTGRPKPVGVRQEGVTRLAEGNHYRPQPDDVFLFHSPMAFDASTFEIWGALLNGLPCVIQPPGPYGLDELGRTIQGEGVKILWLTSGVLNLMVDHALGHLRGVRQLYAGGDALSAPHVKRAHNAGVVVVNGYGPTETTTFAISFTVPPGHVFGATVPIGVPLDGTTVRIVGPDGAEVHPGEAGELWIGGTGIARGYLNRPEATADRFVRMPDHPEHRWYRTGDVGRTLPDGNFDFIGRVDDQVKIRGFRIEPGEVGATLADHPQVATCVVLARKDEVAGKRLIAWWVPMGDAPTDDALRAWLGERLPPHMIPAAFVKLETLPLSATGKLIRDQLPDPPKVGGGTPQTPTQAALATIWSELLGAVPPMDQSFFSSGGDSLLAIHLVAAIRSRLDVALSPSDVFAAPTIAALAERVDHAPSEPLAPLPDVDPTRPFRASPQQEQVYFLCRLSPESRAYNAQAAMHLDGPLDLAIFSESIDALTRRHDALRGGLYAESGRVFMFIAPPTAGNLRIVDVEGPLAEAMARAVGQPFDPGRPPLVVWTLLRQSETRHTLVLSEHHLVHDGWSQAMLLRELMADYHARKAGRSTPLAPVPAHYAALAAWEQDRLADPSDLDAWVQRLSGAPTTLSLPTRWPRPPRPSHIGARLDHQLDAATVRGLAAVGRAEGASLFVSLLTAFSVVLHQLTHRRELVFGSGFANRNRPESEGVVGMFVNTVVMRSRLPATPTFRGQLGAMREMVLFGLARPHIPLTRILQALHLPRSLAEHPLVQAIFSFHDSPMPASGALGIDVEVLHNGSSKLDLNVLGVPRPDGSLALLWEYATELFAAEDVRGWQAKLEAVVRAAVADPDAPLLVEVDEHTPDAPPAIETPTRAAATHDAAALLPIWSRVLARPVSPHDDFFALGGHSLLALQLLAEVQAETGRALPLAALLATPTPAGMAAALAEDAERWPGLVALQPEGRQPPLFCIAGAGTTAVGVRPLAARIGPDQPLYVLQEVDAEGRHAGHTSIDAMARHNLTALRQVQPRGPYRLIGHSFGGYVALRMAQLLVEEGDSVALLGILDTFRVRPRPAEASVHAASRFASQLGRHLLSTTVPRALHVAKDQARVRLERRELRRLEAAGLPIPAAVRRSANLVFYREIMEKVHFAPYPFPVVFFEATKDDPRLFGFGPRVPARDAWGDVLPAMRIVPVAVQHMMLEEPDVDTFVVALRQELAAVATLTR